MTAAPCAGVDMFDPANLPAKLALCDRCPIVEQCRQIDPDASYGIWGGEVRQGTLTERGELLTGDILAAFDGGATRRTIADTLTLSESAVQRVLVKRRPDILAERFAAEAARKADIDVRAVELYAKPGASQRSVAAELGVAMATVQRALERTAA